VTCNCQREHKKKKRGPDPSRKSSRKGGAYVSGKKKKKGRCLGRRERLQRPSAGHRGEGKKLRGEQDRAFWGGGEIEMSLVQRVDAD